ncbi:YciI family protein [Dactylosporangium sp. NPDC000555]|uniref:YciI family protein n=1 Tax=Dactylosporangium sp. NPDC000555 TaxID=3154260 RepID=UPI003334973C
MILSYASQRDYDAMAGKPGQTPETPWTPEDFACLDAPVHTRRVSGAPAVVTDGPYAETQEVLAGYWIVECDSFDRATQIAMRLGECPAPPEVAATAYADVRPIVEASAELGF